MLTGSDVRIMSALVRDNDELGGRALELIRQKACDPETGDRVGPIGAVMLASKKMQEEKAQTTSR